ncbi:MAG: SDR family NAD(P)-dependent oxidoreductase [Candidatus Woesearchaeota archaeon]
MRYTLITGASSGIGLEFAKVFARNKHNLVLVARREELLNDLKKDLESKYKVDIIVIKEDLSDIKSAYRLKEKLKDKKVNVLVNNAGFGDKSLFAKSNIKKIEDMVTLNVTTLTLLTRLFVEDLIKLKGKILNVASVAAFQPGPFMSVYYATKAYVLNFTEALSKELEGKVKVSCLCPGPTRTEFDKVANAKFQGSIPTAREVAVYGYNCLNKGKVVAVHGFLFRILVQLNRLLPRSVIRSLSYKVNKEL